MYPHPQIWRPLVSMGALVAATIFATATITVAPGDTLSEIAERHDVTVVELMEWNELDDPDRIHAGATLIVAAPTTGEAAANPSTVEHVVTAGDTLSGIAARFGTSVAKLVAANQFTDPDRIFIGQTIALEAASSTTTTTAPPRQHTVVAGDTLSTIAQRYGMKTGVLAADNGIANADLIVIGMVLTIGEPAPSSPTPPAKPPSTTVPTPATTTTPPKNTRDADEVLLTPIFSHWAEVYAVPADLLEAIAWHESNWTPDAVGPGGHLGITQLSSDTVDLIEGGLLGREMDPLDADDGIQMGARFLRYLLDRTDSEREATAAWLQGLHSVSTDGVSTAGDQYVDAIVEIRLLRS